MPDYQALLAYEFPRQRLAPNDGRRPSHFDVIDGGGHTLRLRVPSPLVLARIVIAPALTARHEYFRQVETYALARRPAGAASAPVEVSDVALREEVIALLKAAPAGAWHMPSAQLAKLTEHARNDVLHPFAAEIIQRFRSASRFPKWVPADAVSTRAPAMTSTERARAARERQRAREEAMSEQWFRVALDDPEDSPLEAARIGANELYRHAAAAIEDWGYGGDDIGGHPIVVPSRRSFLRVADRIFGESRRDSVGSFYPGPRGQLAPGRISTSAP